MNRHSSRLAETFESLDRSVPPSLLLSIALSLLFPLAATAAPPNFQDDILPVFREHCLSCHNPDDQEAGLDLSSYTAALKGSSGGEIVKAGLPDTSTLYLVISHHEDYSAMPPEQPRLSDMTLSLVKSWIAEGLLPSKDGKSQLRTMSFDISAGSLNRPENPAFPASLTDVPMADTVNPAPVIGMAASPWANLVAVTGYRQILLYGDSEEASSENKTNWQHVGTLPFREGDIHDLRFSRNGDLLIAAGGIGAKSGRVIVFDVKTGKRIATLADEFDVVLSADITSDHQYVAVGTPAKLVKIYATKDGSLKHRIRKHTDWVTAVRFSPDGTQLASADRNGGIHVWDTTSGGIVYTLDEHKVPVTSLRWRSDGKVLASGAEDGKFVLWDMNDGWATRSIPAHTEKSESRYSRRTGILDLAFAPDGRLLTSGRDQKLRVWAADGKRGATLDRLPGLPLRIEFASSGQQVFVGGLDGSTTVVDIATMKPVGALLPKARGVRQLR